MGNEAAYRDILALYAANCDKKTALTDELFTKEDLMNYVIEVHALKSTSLSIDAVRVSELARELEAEGKAGKLSVIKEKTGEMLRLYREAAETARHYPEATGQSEPQQEKAVDKELTEVSAGVLAEYIERGTVACTDCDGDAPEAIAEEVGAFSFGGEPLRDYFAKAGELANEKFEYEAAANEIAMLEDLRMGTRLPQRTFWNIWKAAARNQRPVRRLQRNTGSFLTMP